MEPKPITGKEYFTLTKFVERTVASTLTPVFPEERIVFGARMPGYGARSIPESVVVRWIGIMKEKSIERVCCLLPPSQLGYYLVDLLAVYAREFGEGNVFWAPIEDYHLCSPSMLRAILTFLKESEAADEPVVVHCAGGRGRTGFIHACWLVCGRGFSVEEALVEVRRMGRNPLEAVELGNASLEELFQLLHLQSNSGG